MQISNGQLKGKEVGFVSASYVSSRVFYKDFFNSIRNLMGWELKSYTSMLDFSRDEVIKRLIEKAQSVGATGLSNIKFEVSYMSSGSLAIMGYATAVVVE